MYMRVSMRRLWIRWALNRGHKGNQGQGVYSTGKEGEMRVWSQTRAALPALGCRGRGEPEGRGLSF